jgi:hypothetical protein
MANGSDSIWTDELIARFREMHRSGASFVVIGEALGVTKNACIGKARRLGLVLRRSPNGTRKPKSKRPRTPKVKAASKPILRIVRAGYGSGLRVAKSVTLDVPVFTCVDVGSLDKTLVELGNNECKYIAGDPREGALYCGHPIFKRSYCQTHFERCYVEPLKRWSEAA